MEFWFNYLVAAGVTPEIASWGVVIVSTLCVAAILRVVASLCK